MSGAGSQQGTPALFHEDSGRPERTARMWLAPELSTSGVYEAMGLCILTASLRKPNGRRHSRRTAVGLAAGRGYQWEPSCSSLPCRQSVHEPRSTRCVVTEIAARSGSDVEPWSMLWQQLWCGSSWSCQRQRRPEVADGRNWLHVSAANADRTRRDLMLSMRRCAPENFSLGVIQLQPFGCHPSRNLIDTDGHYLAEVGRICRSAKPVDLSVWTELNFY